MGPWGAVLLLCLAAGEPDAGVRVAPQDPYEELVVELAIGRIARRTVLALERRGTWLLPARDFFELAEMDVRVDSAGRLSGVRHPEGTAFGVDPTTSRAAVGPSTFDVDPLEVAWRDGGLYLATSLLERLLDLDLHVDAVELRVSVTNPEGMPVARRVARERARAAREAAAGLDVDRRFGLRRPTWDGAVFDWGVFFPGGRPLNEMSYRVGLGLNVLGGSLETEHEGTGRGAAGANRTRASWLGVWPEQGWLRQLGLGDVAGTGPRPTAIRGAFLSNSPFVRSARFGDGVLLGELAPGWDVEVYRDGALVDYGAAGPDGSFRLETPLQYGPNPLEVRAYGPSGQVEVWSRAIRVQAERLPRGVFEYGLSVGDCRGRPCETHENVDLHYGVSRAWTLRAGAEAFQRHTLPDLFQPYASLTGVVATRWAVRVEGLARGFAGGDLTYEPSPDLRVGAAGAWFDEDVSAPILTPVGRRADLFGFAFWRPIPARRSLFFDASARRVDAATLTLTTLRLGGSAQLRAVRWIAGLRHERAVSGGVETTRSILDVGGSATVRWRRVRPLHGIFVRGALEVSDRGLESADAFASRAVLPGARAELRLGWTRGSDEPFVAFGFATTVQAARSFSQLSRTPGGEVVASNLTEGSLLWNTAVGRVETAPGRSLRRGGVGGVVFLDRNGNGRYDEGDEPLSDVALRVGPHTVRTDRDGRFAIWDLVPFVTERIVVDSFSLESPLWVPSFGLATIVTAPNGFAQVQVPVWNGAEVAGRVLRAGPRGPEPVGGLRVELLDEETGRRHEATTFSDGEFYVLGLPPGTYEVRIPEEVLAALGVRPPDPPVRIHVRADADGVARAPFVEIELSPRGP